MKASINGPNRRRNRVGDRSIATNFESNNNNARSTKSGEEEKEIGGEPTVLSFRIRSLEKILQENESKNGNDDDDITFSSLGDACIFTYRSEGCGLSLLKTHLQMIDSSFDDDVISSNQINSNDPVLIHFHDLPVFVLRAIPIQKNKINHDNSSGTTTTNLDEDCIYLSQAHCHNHKICEDTIYQIRCCSRPSPARTIQDYDELSAVQIDVYRRYSNSMFAMKDNAEQQKKEEEKGEKDCVHIPANLISKELMNHTNRSVLTVNELITVSVLDTELVCRVSNVRIEQTKTTTTTCQNDDKEAAEVSMDDPYRGRVNINTDFYIAGSSGSSSSSSSLIIDGTTILPEGELPEDVIHVTTNDMEWFPVRRMLLVPCIKLTKYVQAGRGKYKQNTTTTTTATENNNNPKNEMKEEDRSPDAPTNDGRPHCKVDIDCCTFDRVLLFIMSMLYPSSSEYKFALDLSEITSLSHAAEVLGLQPLSDLCASQVKSFHSRVRKDKYIRFAEVQQRNKDNGLLIILDGMVLDITRWIDEHPGGPSIIPSQALNIDCTCFFEMYHISRQSFLYLKSFYIGELSPEDFELLKNSRTDGASASQGFLQSLRSYTSQWRITVEEGNDQTVHKSL